MLKPLEINWLEEVLKFGSAPLGFCDNLTLLDIFIAKLVFLHHFLFLFGCEQNNYPPAVLQE